ncbi:MAG: hypothetical protein H0U33_07625 [Solirubrobacterales bacterium]|nr:hypothetical protein [Solirubrobacterales bacterium]
MSVATGPRSTEPALELLRFRAVPAGSDAAVLELEGRFATPAPRRLGRPRLLVESEDGQVEAVAISGQEAFAGPDAAVWRATYALPLAAVDGTFTIAVGRRLTLTLPAPYVETAEGAPAAHHVRLAREVNGLRRRADEAEVAADAASTRGDELDEQLKKAREQAEALRGELSTAREAARAADQSTEGAAREMEAERERERASAASAAQELEAERLVANRTIDRVRREAEMRGQQTQQEHTRRLEATRREHEEAMARASEESLHRLEEAVAAQRAQTLRARHDLKAARAELEAISQEQPAARDATTTTGEHALGLDSDDLEPSTDEVAQAAIEEERRRARTTEVSDDTGGQRPDLATRPITLELADDATAATTQTVRVLNPRARRPRRDLAAEAKEANESRTLPGAAEIGAQHIAPATDRRDLTARAAGDPARTLAVAALAIFVLAVFVIVLGVGPF